MQIKNSSNTIIIGGGAAGLWAAADLFKSGVDVTVFEKMPRLGTKLLITGKGRCNITNNCETSVFLQNVIKGGQFLHSAVHCMPPNAVIERFEGVDLPLKTERGGRVFPQSDRARDVLNTLIKMSGSTNYITGTAVSKILTQNGKACGVQLSDGTDHFAGCVLIATGGASYPGTGSSGDGYTLAATVGHSIIKPFPSLVPLLSCDTVCKRLMGLSLKNVKVTLTVDGAERFCEQGEMLFTHFGLSGPLILTASCALPESFKKAVISIDLKPAMSLPQLDKIVHSDFVSLGAKTAIHALDALLPKKMIPVMLELWGITPTKKANQITRPQRDRIVSLLKNFDISITGTHKIEYAIITAGGVNTKEIDPKTMSSKILPGLFFAGEVIDANGPTGGYNLQIAFSTAGAAAEGMRKYLGK